MFGKSYFCVNCNLLNVAVLRKLTLFEMNYSFFSQRPDTGTLSEWTRPLGSFFSEQWRLLVFLSVLLLLVTHYLLPYLLAHYKKEQLYRLMPTPVTSPILGSILGHLEVYWNAPAEMKNLPPSVCTYYPPPQSTQKKYALFHNSRFGYSGAHHFINRLVLPIQKAGESLFFFRFGPFRKFVMIIKGEAAKVRGERRRRLISVSASIC